MSTMHFADEVVPSSDIDGIPSRASKPATKALRLAEQIVDALSGEWDPDQYHDTYTEELEGIIARKDKGKADVVEDTGTTEPRADVGDLMAALEASIATSGGGRSSSGRPKRAAGKKGAASGTTAKRRTRSRPTERKKPAARTAARKAS